jgi:hypothetical protein
MKAISPFSLATVLILTGVAFAQTPPAPNPTEDAPPAAKDSKQANPGSMSPSAAKDVNQASTRSTSQSCTKQASDKKLTGDDKTKFVKDCKAGNTTRSGN